MDTNVTPPKDQQPRKALGRGLAALIPSAAGQPVTPSSAAPNTPGLRLLPIERVVPMRTQPRKVFDDQALEELSASITEQGVLQPIVVRRRGENYEIVAGERRWRAATKAGLHDIPAIVKELSDTAALEIALIENIQRQDLDPLEEAEAYGRLVREHGLTQEQVAQRVGKNRATVTNALRLLKLPEAVLKLLADGRLTAGHARALMTVESESALVKLAGDLAERRVPVREAERLARQLQHATAKPSSTSSEEKSPAERNVEERLMRALGTKVRLKHRQGKGSIEVFFHSLDELDRLLEKMAK